MARLRFHERALSRLAPGTYWDERLPGFGLQIRESGSRSFIIQYRVRGGGKYGPSRRMTLGPCPPLTLARARRKAEQLLAAVVTGEDPARERKRESRSPTVRALAERFEAEHLPR